MLLFVVGRHLNIMENDVLMKESKLPKQQKAEIINNNNERKKKKRRPDVDCKAKLPL